MNDAVERACAPGVRAATASAGSRSTATVSPSSSDIQVASTAVRSEVTSASVTGTSSACCSPVVAERPVVGEAPDAVRAQRAHDQGQDRAGHEQREQRRRDQGRRVAPREPPRPGRRPGRPTGPPYDGRARPPSSRPVTTTQLQDRQGGRRLQVEQVGGEQVDLGLDRAVAQPAQGEHHAERRGAEEEHHGGRGHDRRSQGRAASRSAAPGPGVAPRAAAASAGRGSSDSQAPPTTRITTEALKNTSPAMIATAEPSKPRKPSGPLSPISCRNATPTTTVGSTNGASSAARSTFPPGSRRR